MVTKDTYRENFIKLIKVLMADTGIDYYKDCAAYLGIPIVTMNQIMSRGQYPTTDQGQVLCIKGGFNANFLWLNKPPVKMQELSNMAEIKKYMKEIATKSRK